MFWLSRTFKARVIKNLVLAAFRPITQQHIVERISPSLITCQYQGIAKGIILHFKGQPESKPLHQTTRYPSSPITDKPVNGPTIPYIFCTSPADTSIRSENQIEACLGETLFAPSCQEGGAHVGRCLSNCHAGRFHRRYLRFSGSAST